MAPVVDCRADSCLTTGEAESEVAMVADSSSSTDEELIAIDSDSVDEPAGISDVEELVLLVVVLVEDCSTLDTLTDAAAANFCCTFLSCMDDETPTASNPNEEAREREVDEK